jgi:hypothetical protein
MALENSDVFVVQKQASGEVRKITAQQLDTYLQAGDSVVYKGTGDFTNLSDNPAVKNVGDLYINDALNAGNFVWLPAPNPVPVVNPGDQCIWDGVKWDIIPSGGGAGVSEIEGTEPIEVNSNDAAKPIISIKPATQAAFGAVQLADDDDLTNKATNRVVTADQLQAVDEKVDGALSGGVVSVQGVDPIVTSTTDDGGTVNSPAISIKDAAVSQKGAIAKFDTSTDIGGPIDSDAATWKGALDDTSAITIKAAGSNFLLSDFSKYEDIG